MSSTLTYGSVRGVPGDRHPYRDPVPFQVPFQKAGEMGARLDPHYGLESFHPPSSGSVPELPSRTPAELPRGVSSLPEMAGNLQPNLVLFQTFLSPIQAG